MNFKDYKEDKLITDLYEQHILALVYMANNDHLNESLLEEGISNWFKKFKQGLKDTKEQGIIDYAFNFASTSGKLILAAIKGDTETVKEISDKIDKDDFIDFLLKLDQVFLTVLAAPLDIITGVTGWNIKKALSTSVAGVKASINNFKKAMVDVKTSIDVLLQGKNKAKIVSSLNNIEKSIPALDNIKKINKSDYKNIKM